MKKIKLNGKALTKYDIARLLESIDYHTHACICYEMYTYTEMCEWLYRKLKRYPHHYLNSENIEWFDNIAPF